MTIGYSMRVRDANAQANNNNAGVRLGRFCIERDIPVQAIAKTMGVTRATVYNWFCGVSAPQSSLVEKIEAYIVSQGNEGQQL